MNIEHIKNKIKLLVGEKIRVKVYLGRNKYEYFDGVVEKMHPNLFTIKTDSGIKSFSYSDILIKTIILNKIN